MVDRVSPLPLHPEPVEGDRSTVRWVVPAGVTPFVGAVRSTPGDLGALLAEGVVAAVRLEPAAVVVTLREGGDWRAVGARVREALVAALDEPTGWQPQGEPWTPDEALLAAAEEVAAGSAGDYVRSHGGRVEVVSASDGVIRLRLGGTCAGCGAVARTLEATFETELRRRCPELVRVEPA